MLCRFSFTVFTVFLTLEMTDASSNVSSKASGDINFANGNCVYHIFPQAKVNLSQANGACRNLEGSLAIIKDETIQSLLENKTASHLNGTSPIISLWIGGYKRNSTWFWEDFSEIDRAGAFTNWRANRPGDQGNGLIISPPKREWTSFNWLDEDESSTHGYICEVAEKSICTIGVCQNGGICKEIGCHKYCICQQGYGGDDCETDFFKVTLLSQNSLIVDAGKSVTVKLNISSADGPATIKVWNSTDQCTPAYVKYKAIGETEIRLGRMWNTGLTTTYRFEAILEKNATLHQEEVLVNVTVRNVQGVESFEVYRCGTNVSISYIPHNTSLRLEHRIEILNEGINTSVYPSKATRHHLQFVSLSENSRFIAKITVCPRCRHPASNRTSFRTTIADLSQVIRHFHIYKEYQTKNCTLIWSNDFPVSEYQLTTTYQDIVPSDSRQPYTQTTRFSSQQHQRFSSQSNQRFSSQQNQRFVRMKVGKNYTFTLSATTCGGIGQPVQSVGQCIHEEDEKPGDAPVQKSQNSAMLMVLGALFGLSVLTNAILIFLCIRRRKRQIQGDMKHESTTGVESATRSQPYQTTYFENTATDKDKYNDDPCDSSDKEMLKQNPPTYENTKPKSSTNGGEIPSTDYENMWPASSLPTFDGSASDGYVTPITHATDMAKDSSVYQYENSSKSGDRKDEEYPDWDGDSFTSQDSDDVSNSAIHSRQASSAAMKQSPSVPLPWLSTNPRNMEPSIHQKTETALTPGNSNAVLTPVLVVKQGKALTPPTSAKAFSSPSQNNGVGKMPMKPAVANLLPGYVSKVKQGKALTPPTSAKALSSPSQNNGLGKMPMKPSVANLLPGYVSKLQTNDQNSKFHPKPLKTLPKMNLDRRANTEGHSEVAAALARLKPIGVRK